MNGSRAIKWEEIPQDNGETAYVAFWPLGEGFEAYEPMEICVCGWDGGAGWSHDYAHPDSGSWLGEDRSYKWDREAAMSAALAGAPAEAAKLRAELGLPTL